MPTDDRERNFEKAMARELRAAAPDGLHCPDAETLAAYHERLLTPEEMAAQKSHIVSCARCQEVLATLEITETISSEKEQDVVAMTAQKTMHAVAAAPVFSRPDEAAGRESSKLREMPGRKPYLRWAVPAGAIAAGLLVWVAINFNGSQRKAAMQRSTSAPVEVAENREQKEPRLAAPKLEAGAPAEKAQSALKSDDDRKQALADEADKELTGRFEKSSRAKLGTAANLPHGPRVLQNQAQNQMQNNANASDAFSSRQNQVAGASGAAVGGDLSGVVGGLSKSAPAPSAPPMAPPKRREEAKKAEIPPPPPPAVVSADVGVRKDVPMATETVEVTGNAPAVQTESAAKEKKALDYGAVSQQLPAQNETAMLEIRGRNVRDLGQTIVWTTDPKVFWLVLNDGSLRKSENSGKSSVVQNLGDGIKAIAGAATNAKTCWVLAEGNLVFKTVDGGKHWTQVSTPSGADFKTIAAGDKKRATVTGAAGAVKLTTTDGGATWVAVKP